ncbi:Terminase small subunit [compost metagenome]
MALTAKQELFVQEYLKDLNATQAAIRAGYSPNTASETGYENLRKPQIAAEIEKRQAKIGADNEITVEWILGEIKDTYKQAKEIGGLNTANKSLEMLGRYKGIFNDKLKVDATVTKKLEEFFT